MTTQFTLALAQTNPTVGDFTGNAARMLEFAVRAADMGADLVLYPEMALVGYPPEDLVLVPAFRSAAMDAAKQLAARTKELPCDLIFGAIWEEGGQIFNASLLASGGKLTLLRAKHDLPNYGVFDEKRVFAVGPEPKVIDWRGVKLGLLICEEVWDVDAAKKLGAQGAELLLVQNASPYHIGKAGQRKQVVDAATAATGLPLVYLNLVGGQDELVFDGRSYIDMPDGTDAARLSAFKEELAITRWQKIPLPEGEEGARAGGKVRAIRLLPAALIEKSRRLRKNQTDAEKLLWSLLRNCQLQDMKFRRQYAVGKYVADFACLEIKLIVELDGSQHLDMKRETDVERTAYLESQGWSILRFWKHEMLEQPTAVLEMIAGHESPHPPGGAWPLPLPLGEGVQWHCISGPMVNTRSDEETIYHALVLGLRDYVQKNGFPGVVLGLSGGIDSGLTAAIAADALGPQKVFTIRLPSPYSSIDTMEDAEQLAAALQLRMETVNITPAMEAVAASLGGLFTGTERNTTEENIQARLRGLLLMAVSNKFGPMVLTTGNKSEMSVGYATLYGDMCGGFSVLKDVYKTTVTKLSHWRSAQSAEVLAELGFLGAGGQVIPERMITKPPTAELRENQKDEDSLPPYAVLDTILRGLIERQLSVRELVAEGMDQDTVEKVARLVWAAEYKRRQSAPGVKITPMAFGRDRRWPITNRWKFA